MKRITFLLFFLPGLAQNSNTAITNNKDYQDQQKRFLSVMGLVYGPVTSVKESVTASGSSSTTIYTIDEEGRTLTLVSEKGEILARHYFNLKWELVSAKLKTDSIVYYLTPFAEYFEHYKYADKTLYDSNHLIIDLKNRKIIDPSLNENTVYTFTKDGLLSTRKDLNSILEECLYDENGNLISRKVKEGNGMYEKEINLYKYDEHKNWIINRQKNI